MQIGHPLLVKLRTQKSTCLTPFLPIDVEYPIAKELNQPSLGTYELPGIMEDLALSKVLELCCENSFDVFGVDCDNGCCSRGT
jgi:hypothetical protein